MEGGGTLGFAAEHQSVEGAGPRWLPTFLSVSSLPATRTGPTGSWIIAEIPLIEITRKSDIEGW